MLDLLFISIRTENASLYIFNSLFFICLCKVTAEFFINIIVRKNYRVVLTIVAFNS
jgi:hypothetical protein